MRFLGISTRLQRRNHQDLCDRLLERGVLVYDSARELLAIDVRQRKEQLAPEESLAIQGLGRWFRGKLLRKKVVGGA